MSTEAATIIETPTPAPPITGGDEFTPEERAYFESRGEKTEGLAKEPKQVAKDVAKEPAREAATEQDEESVDGEVALDALGNRRDLKSGKFVPKSAFLRVKEEAKTTKAENQALRDNLIATRERAAILAEAQAPAVTEPQKPLPPPDPETDIFAFVKWQAQEIERLKNDFTRSSKETEADREARQYQEIFTRDVADYASKVPEFMGAYEHLITQRAKQLEALGVKDAEKRDKILKKEASDLVREAIQERESPAERIYKMAATYGFVPKAANDRAAQTAADEIKRIEQGKQASNSLRSAGSGSGVGEQLTPQKLAAMSDAEFITTRKSYIERHGKTAWTNLTGTS